MRYTINFFYDRRLTDPRNSAINVLPLTERITNRLVAGWSSLVARRAHNPKVVGSNPAPATISKYLKSQANLKIKILWFYGSTRSMVELTQNLKHLKYLASEVCSY